MKKACVTAAAWLLVLIIPSLSPAQQVNVQAVSESDHFRHPMKDKYYTENWNYQVIQDSGELLSLSFSYSNLGVTSGSASVQFTLGRPGSAPPLTVRDEMNPSNYGENAQAGAILIGVHSIAVKDNVTRLIFSRKEVKLELTIHPWVSGFQVGDGVTMINKEKGEFYRTFIEIPRGDAEGTLTVQGVERPIKGAAYMDHTVSNILQIAYSSHWYSLRAFLQDYTVALLEFQYLPKAGGGRWALGYAANREKILGVSTDYKAEASGEYKDKSCTVPTGFAVQMSAGDILLNGSFQSREAYGCISVLESLNWVTRKLAGAFAGNPIVCRFLSNADLNLTIGNKAIHLEGPAYQGIVSMGN